jgi:hypothetical protein
MAVGHASCFARLNLESVRAACFAVSPTPPAAAALSSCCHRALGGPGAPPPVAASRTDQPAGTAAGSEVEHAEEPERVVGESDLFEAEGGPELKHLVEGNAEDEFDVGLCGFIEQRRQNQSNASGSVAER